MSILLILLKIIAIILAVIFVFLLLCLFHPVFYQVEGIMEEKRQPVLKGCFWWLFRLLGLEFGFSEGNVAVSFRIFGFRRELSGGQPKEETEGVLGREPEVKGEFDGKPQVQTKENSGREPEAQAKENSGGKPQAKAKENSGGEPEAQAKENSGGEPEAKKKAPEEQELDRKKERSRKRQKPGDKTGEKEEKPGRFAFLSALREEIKDEKNKLAVSHVWREIIYLFSRLKPRHARGELNFSTGDPAFTGKVTGILSLFPFTYQSGVHIYPDFSSDVFYIRGQIMIKGHMALYHTVLILLRLFGDRNIRRLIKKIRK